MAIQNGEHAYREFMVELKPGESFTQHHIKVRKEDVSRYMFIPGSHLRGRRIAERLENCRLVGATRGYYVYTGTYKGVTMSVCSTGMGGPVVAIAMEELGNLGVDTFVRVGSAGAISDDLGVGDIALATATYRDGGTSYNYLPAAFPAVADFYLTHDLTDAARDMHIGVHVGVCTAGDAFYGPKDAERSARLKKAGVVAVEMESDTEFIVGAYHGFRCAAGFVLDGGNKKKIKESSAAGMEIANHATNEDFLKGEDDLITVALEGMLRCAQRDAAAGHREGAQSLA